ncbi:MAG: N-acetyltransferase [Erysipelotrichia bacterium]|nr:N-acetyltransferase [Erysipelotrichia bacterium]
MGRSHSVFLRKEIHEQDCQNMVRWISNNDVSRYLNESHDLKNDIEELFQSAGEEMIALHLNQDGHFYLVCEEDSSSIGYVKLSHLTDRCYEVVYCIGEENLWGHGLGKETLARTLRVAFLEKRADSVVARIDHDNKRSLRTAAHCGMKYMKDFHQMAVFRITAEEFFHQLGA